MAKSKAKVKGPPTDTQIDHVLNECAEQEERGGSRWPAMTYEQGVQAAIRWIREGGPSPVEDE